MLALYARILKVKTRPGLPAYDDACILPHASYELHTHKTKPLLVGGLRHVLEALSWNGRGGITVPEIMRLINGQVLMELVENAICPADVADRDWRVEAIANVGENIRVATEGPDSTVEFCSHDLELSIIYHDSNYIGDDLGKYLGSCCTQT